MSVPFHGQLVVTAAPQQLTTQLIECGGFTIKASVNNSGTVYLGAATVTGSGTNGGYFLDPGETFEYQRNVSIAARQYTLSPQDFYILGTSGDIVSWLASP